jgi:hypothetical protein
MPNARDFEPVPRHALSQKINGFHVPIQVPFPRQWHVSCFTEWVNVSTYLHPAPPHAHMEDDDASG